MGIDEDTHDNYPQPWFGLIWIIAIGFTALFWWSLWILAVN